MLDRVDKKREKVSRKRVSCSLQEPLCSSNLPTKKRRCWHMSESMQGAYLSAAVRRGQVCRGYQAGLSSCWGSLCRCGYRGQPCGCVQAPGASCDVQSVRNDLPPQAAAADQLYLEEQAAEYERSVAPAEPRRKKLRTPAAAPLTGVLCHYHGCVNILPDAEGSCPAQLFSRPPLKSCVACCRKTATRNSCQGHRLQEAAHTGCHALDRCLCHHHGCVA